MLRLRPVYVPQFLQQAPPAQALSAGVQTAGVAATETDVGASGVSTVIGGLVYLVAAGVEGAFSYALYTGKYIFTSKHPVWGTIFALLTMTHLYKAGDRLTASN